MNSIIWENAGNRVLRVEGFGSNATLNLPEQSRSATIRESMMIPPLRAAARLPFRVKVSLQSRWMTMPFSSEITRLPQAERLEEAQFWRSPTMPGSLWATAPFSMPTMFLASDKAGGGGGAMFTKGGSSSIEIGDDATFTDNYVQAGKSSYGGAIGADRNATSITLGDRATFSGNHISTSADGAASEGGAISTYITIGDASVTLGDRAVFTGNYILAAGTGKGAGGAVAVRANGGPASLTVGAGASFTGNYISASSGDGGAIWMSSGGACTLGANVSFTGNYIQASSGSGGAIYLKNQQLTIQDGAISRTITRPRQGEPS